MESPFDDPELSAQLEAMGVRHSPGLADRMMQELAPLLAAEGIDLDDLDDADLDEVNAALARATERHNLALFTPVGTQRADALAVLREFAVGFADERDPRPFAVLDAVEIEPADGAAAISHVMGVAIELLDDWHTNPAWDEVLVVTRVRRGPRAAQAAAKDLPAPARKGRAFGSLGQLHRGHSGLAIFQGAALLVADGIGRRAAVEGEDVRAVAFRELTAAPRLRLVRGEGEAGSGPGGSGSAFGAGAEGGSGSAFGAGAGAGATGSSFVRDGASVSSFVRPAAPGSAAPGPGRASGGSIRSRDQTLVREFGDWLRRQEAIAAPEPAQEVELFEVLQSVARGNGLDLREPDDIDVLIDIVLDLEQDGPDGDEAVEQALETLHDYVHFRLETVADPAAWDDAHEAIELALDDVDPGRAVVIEAVAATQAVGLSDRRAALAALPMITGVDRLLEWVGSGRAVTSTGAVRRADIEVVAGMLGISAVGVAKYSGSSTGASEAPGAWRGGDEVMRGSTGPAASAPVEARSMFDLPLLTAWWEALQIAEIIGVSATRVRRGAAADRWGLELPARDEDAAGLELAEHLIELVVADLITRDGLIDESEFGAELVETRVEAVLGLVDLELHGLDELSPLEQYVVSRLVVELEKLGLAGVEDSGLTVPDALKGPVAKGAMLGRAFSRRR